MSNKRETDKRPTQKHPQAHIDSVIAQDILTGDRDDYKMAELARLRIRYRGFPGAYDIQANLDQALDRWQLTEEELFAYVRTIHANQRFYTIETRKKEEEDWS